MAFSLLHSVQRDKKLKMAAESGPPDNPHDATKEAETVIVGRDVEEVTTHSYRPSKWQSNITIISCVSSQIHRLKLLLLTQLVHRQFQ
jgi:hypothetical protein